MLVLWLPMLPLCLSVSLSLSVCLSVVRPSVRLSVGWLSQNIGCATDWTTNGSWFDSVQGKEIRFFYQGSGDSMYVPQVLSVVAIPPPEVLREHGSDSQRLILI
jgi:hypothetical protein